MSKREIQKRIRELERLLEIEKRRLERIPKVKPRRKIIKLFVTKRITRYRSRTTGKFISRSTAKMLGIKGKYYRETRKKGKVVKIEKWKPPKIRIVDNWITTTEYIEKLDRKYHFGKGTKTIPYPYINVKTLVCSNRKENPKGKFNIAQVYFIVQYDNIFLIFDHTFMYREKTVPLKEIYSWSKRTAFNHLQRIFRRAKFSVEKVIGYGFIKPKKIKDKSNNS